MSTHIFQGIIRHMESMCRLHVIRNVGFLANNADEIQDDGPGLIPSDISVTNIEGNSVLHDIIFEELAQRSLDRPLYNLLHKINSV